MKASAQYIGKQRPRGNGILTVAAFGLVATATLGCAAPDPREPRGAVALAAEAIERGDGRSLFRLIDQRSRHAFAAIQQARSQARALVQADYPEAERAQALAALGDAAEASDAADLFVRRCPESCQAELGRGLAAPTGEKRVGGAGPDKDDLELQTALGATVRMHKGNDGRYGLRFRNAELFAERDRASRELEQIKQNAEVYRRRRSLEAGAPVALPAAALPGAAK